MSMEKDELYSEYWEFKRFYIKKRPILTACAVLTVASALFITVLLPIINERLTTNKFIVNEPAMARYTGYAIVFFPDGGIFYKGDLVSGHAEGEGALYDKNGTLIYKGGFLSDKYNGYGLLYTENSRLLYSGEFLDNIYNGMGKLYDDSEQLLYDGSFLSGLYDGRGTLYENGETLYTGDFLGGEYNGKGILYRDGIVLFDGSFIKGAYETGSLYNNGDLVYNGSFINGQYDGEGTLYSGDKMVYSGEFLNGEYSGKGKLHENGQLLYEGGFSGGFYDGEGTLYSDGKVLYSGGFSNGEYVGEGTLHENGELLYEGGLKNGQYNGEGTLYSGGVILYSGGFADGTYDGEGTLYSDGEILYSGGFSKGQYNGTGTIYENGMMTYTGDIDMGMKHGKGNEYDEKGKLIYEGDFRQGKEERDTKSIRQIMSIAYVWGNAVIILTCILLLMFKTQIGAFFVLAEPQAFNFAMLFFCVYVFLLFNCYTLIYYYIAVGKISFANIITFMFDFLFPSTFVLILGGTLDIGYIWAHMPLAAIATIITFLPILIIRKVMNKSLSFLLLNDLIYEKSGKHISFSVNSDPAEACKASEKVTEFCKSNDLPPKSAMLISMSIEEMITLIINNKTMEKNFTIAVRIFMLNDTIVLRIRNAGEKFNPVEYYMKNMDKDVEKCVDIIGIKYIAEKAKRIQYSETFGVNNLVVVI